MLIFLLIIIGFQIFFQHSSHANSCEDIEALYYHEELQVCESNENLRNSMPLETPAVTQVNKKMLNIQNPGYTTVYLGIAGQGGGMGAMGHAFIIMAKDSKQILDATAYQYNIFIDEKNSKKVQEASSGGIFSGFQKVKDSADTLFDAPFTLTTANAQSLVNKYTSENRVVLLFKINFTQEQVDEFYFELKQEKIKRDLSPHLDYSVSKNNCLTKSIDLINSALKEKGIDTAWKSGDIDWMKAITPGALISNVPLTIAPILEKHPMFEMPQIYRPEVHREVEVRTSLLVDLEKLQKNCKWGKDKKELIGKMLVNKKIGVTDSFLKHFSSEVQKCKDEKAESNYTDILDTLIFISNSSKVTMKIMEYYP